MALTTTNKTIYTVGQHVQVVPLAVNGYIDYALVGEGDPRYQVSHPNTDGEIVQSIVHQNQLDNPLTT